MNSSRFLWGITFLLTGILWFAVIFGYASADSWGRLLVFWPIVVIFVGLKLILKDSRVFALIGLMILVSIFTYAVYSPLSVGELLGVKSQQSEKAVDVNRESTDQKLQINVDAGAAEISLLPLSEEESRKMLVSLNSIGMEGLTTEKKTLNGNTTLNISEKVENSINLLGINKRSLQLRVARNVPIEFVLSSGATKSNLDFSDVRLTSLTVKSGAASSTIKIGNKEMITNLHIQSGASDYSVSIPKSTGYKVVSQSGLSNVTYPNDKAATVEGNSKKSADYNLKNNVLNIDLESGLTNLKLHTY